MLFIFNGHHSLWMILLHMKDFHVINHLNRIFHQFLVDRKLNDNTIHLYELTSHKLALELYQNAIKY